MNIYELAKQVTPGDWTIKPFLRMDLEDDPLGVYKVEPCAAELERVYSELDPQTDKSFYEQVDKPNHRNAALLAHCQHNFLKLHTEASQAMLRLCQLIYENNMNIDAFQGVLNPLLETLEAMEEVEV